MFSPVIALTAFALILPVELPDKTLMATLVLSTRYRPWPVLLGVSAAFLVQCAIAVTAGRLLGLLPHRVVAGVVAGLFLVGAVILLRGSIEDDEVESRTERSFHGMALTSFGVLFAAEWGDASQLATAAMAARYDDPAAVFLGSFVALVSVAAIAVVLGRTVLRVVPLHLVQRIAGVIFLVFAGIAAFEAVQG